MDAVNGLTADGRLALGEDDIDAVVTAARSWSQPLAEIFGPLAGPPPLMAATVMDGQPGRIELRVTITDSLGLAARLMRAVVMGLADGGYAAEVLPDQAVSDDGMVTRSVTVSGWLVDAVRADIDRIFSNASLAACSFSGEHPELARCTAADQDNLRLRYALTFLLTNGLIAVAPPDEFERYFRTELREPFAGEIATLLNEAVVRRIRFDVGARAARQTMDAFRYPPGGSGQEPT